MCEADELMCPSDPVPRSALVPNDFDGDLFNPKGACQLQPHCYSPQKGRALKEQSKEGQRKENVVDAT